MSAASIDSKSDSKNVSDDWRRYDAIVKKRYEDHIAAEALAGDKGYNLLHWAAYYNQADAISELITRDDKQASQEAKQLEHFTKIEDINKPSAQSHSQHEDGCCTALYVAAKRGALEVVTLLLEKKADATKKANVFAFADRYDNFFEQVSPFQAAVAHKKHSVVDKLGPYALDEYIKERTSVEADYLTTLCCFINFGFSRSEKLAAANGLKQLLNNNQATAENIEKLALDHPAVNQGRLGQVYQAILKAKKSLLVDVENNPLMQFN